MRAGAWSDAGVSVSRPLGRGWEPEAGTRTHSCLLVVVEGRPAVCGRPLFRCF